MEAKFGKKLDRVALARSRELREVEGLLYDLSDPFDRMLFEAVLLDCLDKIETNLSEVA